MNILIGGTFRDNTGYGTYVRRITDMLSQEFTVHYIDKSVYKHNDLPENLKGHEYNPEIEYDVYLLAMTPPYYENLPNVKKIIYYTMFETDRVPRDWLRNIDKCDKCFVPTSFNKHTFSKWSNLSEDKINVIPLPIRKFDTSSANKNEIFNKYRLDTEKKTIITVCDYHPRKGVHDILRLASSTELCRNMDDDYQWIIKFAASHRSREYINIDVNRYNLDKSVHIINEFIPEDDLLGLTSFSDFFFLPTRGEGFGIPMLEAMINGVVPITINWSSMQDYITLTNAIILDYDIVRIPVDEPFIPSVYYNHMWAKPRYNDMLAKLTYALKMSKGKYNMLSSNAKLTAENYTPDRIYESLVYNIKCVIDA